MSYAVGGSSSKPKNRPGPYSKIAQDEENAANPLLGSNLKQRVKVVETKMQSINSKLKQLEQFLKQIGTDVDNQKFRGKVQQTLVET